MPLIKDPLLVAAIDFGTTYSGYAIQFKHEYDKDPTQIRSPQPWNGGKQNLMSYKTPTCLLLDKNKKVVSFGFEAEEQYADYSIEKPPKHTEYYYFKQFKLKLQEGAGLKKDSMLYDETDKPMPALKVFSLSIDCLVDHLMNMLENEGTGVEMKDVLWVLTVPAIWDDAAKGFMKDAAGEAGIEEDHLQIALEPEAASLYCQYLPTEKFCAGTTTKFADAKPGTVYMVVDLGGGTADVTIHEKLSDHKVKEIHKATGGPWGGTAVDNAFWQLFVSIAGGPTMGHFKKTMKYDYLDLMKELECVKRTFCLGMKTKFTIKLPATLNDSCKLKNDGQTFEDLVKESPLYAKSITFVGDKMRMESSLVASLFDKATDDIIKHVGGLLKTTPAGERVTMLLMVGGFSESPYVQAQMKAKLQTDKRKIFIPKEAGLSVLNGAVIYGRKPDTITVRVLRYTYGVEVTPHFEDGVHPEDKKIPGDPPRCNHVLGPFIREGTSVEAGHKVIQAYNTTVPNQKVMAVKIFTCSGDIPRFVTDSSCRHLGSLEVWIPNPSKEQKDLVVCFRFGDTSLEIIAVESDTKAIYTSSMKFE